MHRPSTAGRALALAALLLAAPAVRADLVAETAFLPETLPPGSRDLVFSVAMARAAERGAVDTTPRVQLTVPVTDRVGLTADVGLLLPAGAAGAPEVDEPSLSLKLALTPPEDGAAALSASVDLCASTRAAGDSEARVTLGALRAVGGVTLRAAGGVASAVGHLAPVLQAGASAAVEPAAGWRLLAESVAAWSLAPGGERSAAIGPAVKRALGPRSAVMAALLVGVAGHPGDATGVVQFTVGL